MVELFLFFIEEYALLGMNSDTVNQQGNNLSFVPAENCSIPTCTALTR